ncbi:ABC transporter permease [Mobilitalea sibirica]|uniref:ABC transporter permease n=1 Tax=Mobilitalea sibirica TaxID=1462919 RepID=A0A8J7HAB7_9FIRM|nr:ABC transporter permease [Mobilitalea sibirica]MBH1939776.1 ABC transporter permease [Mobilitalea sibirica]
MGAFIYGVALQWKLDLRNKGVLITYYLVPLLFFAFIGTIFTSINPEAKETLIQSMTIFAITMGAFLGSPIPLVELYSSEIKKAYKVGKIPLWTGIVNNLISAFVHLFLTSIIIFLVAPIAFDATRPDNILFYFVSLAIFLIVCLSVGTVLGLYIKSTSKLTMFSQILFLPSLMLSGIMFPVELLPKGLQTAGFLFPATWGLKIMTRLQVDLLLYLPLIGFFVLACIINFIKLARIGID